ncbi:MAG: hypothetical protein CSB33_03595 [Desulfobacterales bacterium]|nr:MAG: hypothetical protein CSB33_03595 [Desulfobacterales bacterium]
MKRAISLVMAIVFAFAPLTAVADDLCPQPCKDIRRILILPDSEQDVIEPIQPEGDRPSSSNNVINNNAWSHSAFSLGQRAGFNQDTLNERVVFKICDCPDQATYFKAGEIVGIRMTIMTPGVFWTDEPIAIQPFAVESSACAVDNEGKAATVGYDTASARVMARNPVYIGRTEIRDGFIIPHPGYHGTAVASTTTPPPPVWASPAPEALSWSHVAVGGSQIDPAAFPPAAGADPLMETLTNMVKYATVPDPTTQTATYEYFMSDGVTNVIPIDATTPPTSLVAPNNRAQVVQVKGAYQIGLIEDHFNLSRWWIDIPEMRYDFSIVSPGDVVNIKIEWLNDAGTGICGDCETVCECTFTIGTFETEVATVFVRSFPYVLTDTSPWFTGIAISNMDVDGTAIENMEATLTIMDVTGATYTYTKTDFNESVWVFGLDSILDEFSGTPAAGAATLTVESNFALDGYEFLTDGTFGAGTLAR